MRDFLRNLAILGVMAVILYLIVPEQTRQVFGVYNGLGILPIVIILVILVALPRMRDRNR